MKSQYLFYFLWKLKTRSKEIIFTLVPLVSMIAIFELYSPVLIFAACWISYVILISADREESLDYYYTLPGSRLIRTAELSFSKLVYGIPALTLVNLFYQFIPYDRHFNPNRILLNGELITLIMILNCVFLKMYIDTRRTTKSPNRLNSILTWIDSIGRYFIQFSIVLAIIIGVKMIPLPQNWDVLKITTNLMMLLALYMVSLRSTYLSVISESRSFFNLKRSLKYWAVASLLAITGIQVSRNETRNLLTSMIGFQSDQPLIEAIQNSKISTLNNLYQDNPDLRYFVSKKGWSLQALAVHSGDLKTIKWLQAKKIPLDPNQKTRDLKGGQYQGMTLTDLAINTGNTKLVDYLRIHFSFLSDTSKNKYPPLIIATQNCHLEMIEYLLAKGFDINNQDALGQTPLMISVKRKCLAGFLILLEKKPDLSLQDKSGQNIYSLLRGRYQFWYIFNRFLKQEQV